MFTVIKKKILLLCGAAFLFATIHTSCKKYEDGPSFTLLTKRARITGDWKFESLTFNGRDSTAWFAAVLGEDYRWTMKRDGTYSESGNKDDAGSWKLIDNKERISFTSTNPKIAEYSYKILRLTDKEMWLEEFDPRIFATWVMKLKK